MAIIWGCILFGVAVRWIGLGSLVYWHDEAYTSLRISGYMAKTLHADLFGGSVVTPDNLMTYQRLTPDLSFADMMQSLIIEDVQHPPLYYALLRLWAGIFGSSIWAIRSLSAVIGVLALPAAYWFSQELFQHRTDFVRPCMTSSFFVALIAVSPYQMLFAQEAREYVLWTLTTLLSSVALLRSLRLNTCLSWGFYGLTLVVGFYTHLFAVLTIMGHVLYGILVSGRQWKRLLNFIATLTVTSLACIPWLLLALNPEARQGASWTANPIPFDALLRGWGFHIIRAFTLPPADGSLPSLLLYAVLPVLLAMLVYGSIYLIRTAPLTIWSLPLMLAGSAFLPLALPDLIIGGMRSLPSRYLIPLYIGLLVPLAYLFATHIFQKSRFRRLLWSGICGLFIGINALSCLSAARATTTWTKDINHGLLSVAEAINEVPQPLLISTSFGINTGTLLALSRYLKPETRLQLIDDRFQPDFLILPQLPENPGSVFLLNGSLPLRLWLEHQNDLTAELQYGDWFLSLWRLE